jgi:plasmid stabilization system protein ParE
MTARIRTTLRADAQVERISLWWRANRPAAPGLFTDEVAGAFALLTEAPDVGRQLRRRDVPGLRRVLLPRSRHHIYYVHDEERSEVIILAVWSAVRGHGPPLRRDGR